MSQAPDARRPPRYRLVEKLPARVPYLRSARAFQSHLEREVELRVLRGGTSEADTALFFDEVRELAALDHRGFLPILGDLALEGRPCYVVPMRTHPSLAELVQAGDDEFSTEARGRAVRSLAAALSAMHLKQLILGPVRPELIAWNREDGGAYFVHHKPLPDDWKRGLLRHTPLEERPEDYGPADDVFYWGLLSFWLLSRGQHAYGAGPEDLRPIRRLAPEVAPNLAMVVEAALCWERGGRPQAGPELVSVLEMDPGNVADPDPGGESLLDMGRVSAEVRRKVELLRSSGKIPMPSQPAPDEGAGDRDEELRNDDSLVGVAFDLGRLRDEARRHGLGTGGSSDDRAGGSRAWRLGVTVLVVAGVGLGAFLGRGGEAPPAPAASPSASAEGPGGTSRREPTRPPRVGHAPVELKELLAYRQDILPEDFEAIWRKLQALVVAEKLPQGLNDGRRLMRLYVRYRRQPAEACRELQEWIQAIRTKVEAAP